MSIAINSFDEWSRRPHKINIHVGKDRWLGRVSSGSYQLVTPHMHAVDQMMPLPAVRRLMANGELPYIRFGKESYVVVRVPDRTKAQEDPNVSGE